MAQVFVNGEHKDFPEVSRQRENSLLNSGEFFPRNGAAVWIGGVIRWGIFREVGRVSEGFGVAVGPAVVVAGQIGCNGEDPGRERVTGVVAGAVAVEPDEGFLRQITGGGVIGAHAYEEADEALLPPEHEGGHGRVAPGGEFCHEVSVLVVFTRSGHEDSSGAADRV